MTQPASPRELPLPQGYIPIRDILEAKVAPQSIVRTIGVLKDLLAPVPTHGSDYKCTLKLYDLSMGDDYNELVVTIFRPEKDMPRLDLGDVVVVDQAKVQRWKSSDLSLVSHHNSTFHVYAASQIPKPPGSAARALKPHPNPRTPDPKPDTSGYVSYLYHKINKDLLPAPCEFEQAVAQSANVRQKFSQLKDVKPDMFYDIVVMVAKPPYDLGDKMSVWATDFTENSLFFNYQPGGLVNGDPFGYTTRHSGESASEWRGPLGKMSIQLTCWEPHATFIRDSVKEGTWVLLRNVQVKFGKNSANLEGFLRGDYRHPSRVNVDILQVHGDPDNVDPRLKDAIRNKRDYERLAKKQAKADRNTKKRKTGDGAPPQPNSKARRLMKRVEMNARAKAKAEDLPMLDLNPEVSCDNVDEEVRPISKLLERVSYNIDGQGDQCESPFVVGKYRAVVRIVDFAPKKLEDFAVARAITEFDILSDHSGDDSDGSDEDPGTLDRFAGKKIWEWHFGLLLEDASPQGEDEKGSIWVVVDNREGELLTGITACDLRANEQTLANLRHQLFKLWGDLEEYRTKKAEENRKAWRALKAQDRLPPDSSDVKDASRPKGPSEPSFSNRIFSCCIRQYGIPVEEPDPGEADAQDGKRWQRMFGLFGTKISYLDNAIADRPDDK